MAKSKKDKKKFTMSDVVVAARKRLEAIDIEKQGKKAKADADEVICVALAERKIDTLTRDGLQITRVQASHMEYDSDGLYAELTPRQRPLAYDRQYRVSALPEDRQKELMKIMREAMTPSERRMTTFNVLNESRLSEAVQEGKIDAKVVAKHATEVPHKPYGKVTRAGGGG